MNALRDEAKTKVVEPGLPVLDKLRLSPTVFNVLRAEMNDRETWAEFATEAMVLLASMRRMVRCDLTGTNRLLVSIVGAAPHASGVASNGAAAPPTAVGQPYDRRRPLAKASAR